MDKSIEDKWLSVGSIYGKIELLSCEYKPANKEGNRPLKVWRCRCLNCGKEFRASGQWVNQNKDTGCADCKAIAKRRASDTEARTHIGEEYGSLKIIDIAGFINHSRYMVCECQKCGSITEIQYNRLKGGGASKCKYCNRKSLKHGQDLVDMATVDGSCLYSVLPNRKVNKNSTTGVKGVSYSSKTRTYRAYITFRHKQYHLGSYARLEDAAAARKAGEEKIHGGFIEWYKETFPDRWAKLCISEDDISNDA